MSKHRHSKDKLHLTYSQIHNQKKQKKVAFEQLPFYCCALSLAPFQDPVCTPQGHVFDILYIMPFIKKYQRNPVTGGPLKTNQLIKMNWTRSENRNNPLQYQDPISYKIFTQYTHIVCIKTSGYVYAYDTVLQLNKKPKLYNDLVTNQQFQLSDIIHIQDPKNVKSRKVQQFDYLKNNLPFVQIDRLQPSITENQTIQKVMKQVTQNKKKKQQARINQQQEKIKKKAQLQDKKDVNSFIKWSIQSKIFKHQRQTDMSSVSLTSTSWTPNFNGQITFRQLKKAQIRNILYERVKKKKMKGFVQIVTNLGNMNFIIHADFVPKISQNFIQLAQSGYYDNCNFHRLVKDHCLQGGDPSGTGSGGNSIFGYQFQDQFHPKLSHNRVGILSMANSGPNSNKSQFFITLSMNKDLDNKHCVFGQIISNQDLLFTINREYIGKGQRPKYPITITKIFCYDNPFRKAIKEIKNEHLKDKKLIEQVKMEKEKERWIDEDDNKFNIPKNINVVQEKGQQKESLANKLLNDFL